MKGVLQVCSWLRLAIALSLFPLASAAGGAEKDLLDALAAGDIPKTRELIKTGVPAEAEDEFGTRALMYASLYADAGTVRLLLDNGADPNYANPAGSTALMWAISELAKVRLLVERGAKVNAVSTLTGRTALIIAAGRPGTSAVVRFLLEKGADPNAVDKEGYTPLLAAAGSGDTKMVKLLLDHGVDPNVKTTNFFTPLSLAGFTGSRKNIDLLLARGADPSKSPTLLTAVTDAALFRRLFEKGGDPRARGILDIDPMAYVAAHDNADPEVARELLKLGIDPTVGLKNLHTDHGYGTAIETPLDWARRHGETPVSRILSEFVKARAKRRDTISVDPPPRLNAESPRVAVEKALPLLYESNREFFKRSGCVSCHHNMLSAVAFSVARASGIGVDDQMVRANSQQSIAYLKGNQEALLQGIQLTGTDSTVARLLWGLSADGYPRDSATDAAVYHLAGCQMPEGRWRVIPGRPPIESTVSATAIAIRALQAYPLPGRNREFQSRIRRAAKWLAAYSPRTGEERTMRILGLAWAGGVSGNVRRASEELITMQRADGGWSQLDTLTSDAYATGQALYALEIAGQLQKQVRNKGVRFLLETQLADGSWHVRSRSYPVQSNYFDTGFPHGRDQWISAAGTSWACVALGLAQGIRAPAIPI